MSSPRAPRVLVAALLLCALFGTAACSDDGGSDATPGAGTAPDSAPAGDPSTTADGESLTDPGTEPDQENFASFRGVTEDTIRVGVTVADFEALQAAGLPNYQGDNRIAFSAFIDRINAEGGIHGRMIEAVYTDFDFLTPETQDIACSKLTEDEEVFVVLYGLLATSNLCLTELHETMVMTNSFQDTAARERSGDTLWLQLEAADDEQVRVLGTVIAGAGLLDGATIGIMANGLLSDGAAGEALQETLAELGFDADLVITTADNADEVARDNEVVLFAERFRSEGVDVLINLLGGGGGTQLMADSGFRPATTIFSALDVDTEATDKSLLDGALTVDIINDDAVWEDPDFRAACIAPVIDANPDLAEELSAPLPDADQQAAGVASWLVPIRSACNQTMLLKQLGEIAGGDLTNESFRAAVDELGPVEMSGYGLANFTSDGKWDGLDEFHLLEYDSATDSIATVGDPIIVDR